MTALSDEETIIFSDALNHASIIDACRLTKAKVVIYGHTDMKDLEEKLTAYRTHSKKIIVTDGVFSMDGDLAPRSEEHTSELQSRFDLVCRLLLEKKKRINQEQTWT